MANCVTVYHFLDLLIYNLNFDEGSVGAGATTGRNRPTAVSDLGPDFLIQAVLPRENSLAWSADGRIRGAFHWRTQNSMARSQINSEIALRACGKLARSPYFSRGFKSGVRHEHHDLN